MRHLHVLHSSPLCWTVAVMLALHPGDRIAIINENQASADHCEPTALVQRTGSGSDGGIWQLCFQSTRMQGR